MSEPVERPPYPRLAESAREAVRACEVYCVAGCCGLDAFEINREHLLVWARDRGVEHLWAALEQLSDGIGRHDGPIPEGFPGCDAELGLWWGEPSDRADFLRGIQAEVIRAIEIVIRRPLIDPSWRTSTAVALAEAIHADRAFDRLPLLADALEDAGCDHPDVLAHCRGPDPHARGCWVVDLVLGNV